MVGLFLMAYWVMPSLMSGANKPVVDYTLSDWLDAFWARESPDPDKIGMPINYPLWFIRDLMVVMLFSPVVYGLVKYLRYYGVLMLGLLWVMGWWIDIPGLSLTAVFFFSFGALFSVHGKNFVVEMRPLLIPVAVLYAILAACLERGCWHTSDFLAGSSFFVYAYHGMPLALIIKVVVRFFPPETEAGMISLYLGSALFVILVGIALYGLLRRFVPSFLSLITGGR